MNAERNPIEDVAAEARAWFVRLLARDMTPEEISAWENWLRARPEHAAAFDRLAEMWDVAGGARLPRATAEELRAEAYDGSVSVRTWLRRPSRLKLIWTATTCAGVASALGLFVYLQPHLPMDSRQIVTARAEQRAATLTDGSTIVVGAKTHLNVAFSRQTRRMSLAQGQAHFRVAHEAARPFVVETPLGKVTAVGTAFDVDVGSRTVALEVTQGVVSVEPSGVRAKSADHGLQPLRVPAGQKLLLDSDGIRLVQMKPDEPVEPTWVKGLMEFRDAPLRLVLEDINRYAERPIVLADADLGKLAYTGAVKLDNTPAWAKGLEAAFPISADTSGGSAITLRRTSTSGKSK